MIRKLRKDKIKATLQFSRQFRLLDRRVKKSWEKDKGTIKESLDDTNTKED